MTRRQLQTDDLPLTQVDPDNPVPLYYQIEADLRGMIERGLLKPDDLLPPEMMLSEAYGVGRHTIREALTRLAADNLIQRKAGRGTIILPQPDRTRFYLDRSFTRLMADLGMEAHSQVLSSEAGTIQPGRFEDLPKPLRKKCGSRCFHLARLRFADGDPVGLQYTTIVTDRCPGIEQYDFNSHSLYAVLANVYQLPIIEITHVLSAVAADSEQARLLHIQHGGPLLLVKVSAYLQDQQLIEFTSSYYRTDRFEYSITHAIDDD